MCGCSDIHCLCLCYSLLYIWNTRMKTRPLLIADYRCTLHPVNPRTSRKERGHFPATSFTHCTPVTVQVLLLKRTAEGRNLSVNTILSNSDFPSRYFASPPPPLSILPSSITYHHNFTSTTECLPTLLLYASQIIGFFFVMSYPHAQQERTSCVVFSFRALLHLNDQSRSCSVRWDQSRFIEVENTVLCCLV